MMLEVWEQAFMHCIMLIAIAILDPGAYSLDALIFDEAYLLRGQALTDAQSWQQHKSLSELDYQYLRASEAANQKEIQQRLETAQLQADNARLRQEREVSRLKTVLLVVAFGLSALT